MSKQASLFRNIYKFHTYAGIFVAINFTVLALSGLVLLFKDEIQGNPKSSKQEIIGNQKQFAEKYDQALKNIVNMYPHDRPLDIYPDERNSQIIEARLGIDGSTKISGSRRVDLDFNSGQTVRQKEARTSKFFDWMLSLHQNLFMGSSGKLYIGFVGITYVFMLLSGIFLYGKFMKRRSFGDIRSARIAKSADLHKLFGIVSFGWGIIIGISGILLAFNFIFTKNFQEHNLRHLTEQYRNSQQSTQKDAPFYNIINSALTSKPNSVIWYIVFPGMERGIPGHYLVLVHGSTLLTQNFNEYLVINAKTAKLTEIVQLPVLMQSALLAKPLHFANYGGIFLKIIWAFFAICSLAVVLFGILTFFLRFKKRKRNV